MNTDLKWGKWLNTDMQVLDEYYTKLRHFYKSVQIHYGSVITVPLLVSLCLTGEEDKAPRDKKERNNFKKHPVSLLAPEPVWMSPQDHENLIWISHEESKENVN